MTQKEKINILKDTIVKLYEKEGRSIVYISELLNVDRKSLTTAINEWELIKADKRHLNPSSEKFLNKNRQIIIDMLNSDKTITEIANRLDIGRKSLLDTFIKNDKELLHTYNQYKQRQQLNKDNRIQHLKNESSRNYDFEDLENEVWKDILGYPGYQVSNMGRVKKYAKRYDSYYLLSIIYNSESERAYVTLFSDKNKKTLNLARLVALAFVSGKTEENNTVDHKDNDFKNNKAENLEWVSQGENNARAYERGKAPNIGYTKRGKFTKIVMDEKYEFKTIRAMAKFLNISETQASRYLDGESNTEHVFRLVF